jgi:uncharacterized membrane protein YphA (DoxX/SURF4 family)
MRKIHSSVWLLAIFRISLGLVFLFAGIIKSQDIQSFADSMATFQVLPNVLINLLALSLPPFEVIIGGMLLVGWQTRAAALSIVFLLAVFIIVFCQALIRGLNIDCGCFGSEVPSLWKTWGALGRDLLLLVIAVWVYLQLNFSKALEEPC